MKKQIKVFPLCLVMFMVISNFFVKGYNTEDIAEVIKAGSNEVIKQKCVSEVGKVAVQTINLGVNKVSDSKFGDFFLKVSGNLLIAMLASGNLALVAFVTKYGLSFLGRRAIPDYVYKGIHFKDIIRRLKKNKIILHKRNFFLSELLGTYVFLLASYDNEDIISYFAKLCICEGLLDEKTIDDLLVALNSIFGKNVNHDNMYLKNFILQNICKREHVISAFSDFFYSTNTAESKLRSESEPCCSTCICKKLFTIGTDINSAIISRFQNEFVSEFKSYITKIRKFICSFSNVDKTDDSDSSEG
ncbi:MAG: hypothetical protein FWC41_09215 [Firmicutes bacterium]|nr:hypothetical protein [Bacillota bacterium]